MTLEPNPDKNTILRYLWRMKYFISLIFFCFPLSSIHAQQLLTPQAQALGGQSVHLTGTEALFGNPAGLAQLKSWTATAAFERRFLLADLNLMGAATALPTRSGTFSLAAQNFGFEEFRQQTLALGYGRKLSQRLLLGGQLDFYQTQIEEYGNSGLVSFNIGLQAIISEELTLGTQVINPAPVEVAAGENLPTVFRAGAAYRPSQNVMAAFELEKDVDFPLRVKAGFAYQAAEVLSLRVGFSSDPGQFHFGIGLNISENLIVDTAIRYHQTLGLTPSVGVTFNGNN